MKDMLIDTADPTDLAHFAQRREAIDLIATMRARVTRCALYGTFLHHADHTTPAGKGDRDKWAKELEQECAGLDRSRQILNGSDPEGMIPDDICTWIGQHAAQWPEYLDIVDQMYALTRSMAKAAPEGGARLDTALKVAVEFGHFTFYRAVTGFCDGLWARLDEQRHDEVQRARGTAETIADTLKRLEHIGKHVRLVSLNASVEAARVGEAGKGLGVIAVEFKSLAEEIQHLAIHARDRINGLTGNE